MNIDIEKLKEHVGKERLSDIIVECVNRLAASEGNDFSVGLLKACGIIDGDVLIKNESVSAGILLPENYEEAFPSVENSIASAYVAVWQFVSDADDKMNKASFWQIVEDAMREISNDPKAKAALRGGVDLFVSPYFENIIRAGVTFVDAPTADSFGRSDDKFYRFKKMDETKGEGFIVSFGGKSILIELQNG